MIIRTLLLLTFVLGAAPALLAQNNVISKLEIKGKEVYVVSVRNVLLVDTLIMHDKAKIKFESLSDTIYMGVNTAFIGKDCKFLANGQRGTNAKSGVKSAPGQHGANLVIDMHIVQLGNLTIDTRGGTGDKGDEGRGEVQSLKQSDGDGSYKSIRPQVVAEAGSPGGDGGNGGSIFLTYSTDGFIPQFNQGRGPNSINLIFHGGKAGKSGWRSKVDGSDGTDGKVRLVNAKTNI
jgi:hypothetical protein